MANVIVTPISLFVDRVKVGEATGGSFRIRNGVERMPTNDSIAFTRGKTVMDVNWKAIVPRAGMRARLYEAVVSKKDITVQFVADSKTYKVDGKLSEGGADWDHASGRLEGDFAFLGGEPTIS